jgi:hypothetical protein
MSFRVPEWRHIALTAKQRETLDAVKMEDLVPSWEERNYSTIDRVWDLKRHIHFDTHIQQEYTSAQVQDIPSNLVCVHPTDEARQLLPDTKVALDALFQDIQATNTKLSTYLHHKNKKFVVDHSKDGFVIFNFNYTKDYETHGRVASPNEMRHFLQSCPRFAKIDAFWSKYMDIITQHFTGSAQVSPEERVKIESLINEHGDLCIMKYNPGMGMFMHIDNLLRSDATVFTIGLGRDVVYDMTRVIGRKSDEDVSILRSSNPEGTMMVLDGEGRYKWGHSIPFTTNGVKYTIILRLFHNKQLSRVIGKCEELNTDMFTMISPSREPTTISVASLLRRLQDT